MISSRYGVAVTALASALALIPAAVTVADDGHSNLNSGSNPGQGSGAESNSSRKPQVLTLPPTLVASDHGTLQGKVHPLKPGTTYRFEYGTTTEYGQTTTSTAVPAGDPNNWVSVSQIVDGLEPSTTYHFRLLATNGDGTTVGLDKFFTTADADGTSNGHGGGQGVGSSDDSKPNLGQSVVLGKAGGVVKVKKPNERGFSNLEPGDEVPNGTLVDARFGAVNLTSAVSSTSTQTGTFGGGAFEVQQRPNSGGYTDIYLRGYLPFGCDPSTYVPRPANSVFRLKAGAAAARKGRSLWGRDRGGRFRTHGRNSVATVRGTSWITTERCNGTLTYVHEGAVMVQSANGRIVTLTAGHAFLARPNIARPLGVSNLARRLG